MATGTAPVDAKKKKIYRKLLIFIWIMFFIPIIGIYVFFTLAANGSLGFMPTFEELENPKSNLASQIITEDEKVIGTFFHENRVNANYNDLSPYLVDALVATEDFRYEEHSGVDFRSLGRVIFKTVLGGNSSSGGGSTISQQLAKMLFPRKRFGSKYEIAERKFREWVIASRLEKAYTKEEIIAMYFNTFDFLYQAVGINSAADVYFGKKPNQLRIEEAAMLVGMAKNPSIYNPKSNPDDALSRRNQVLFQMMKYNKITRTKYDSLKKLPLVLNYHKVDHRTGLAPYVREYIRTSMRAQKPEPGDNNYSRDSLRWETDPLYGWCNKYKKANGEPYNIYTDGLKIHTTLNYRMQDYAEKGMVKHLKHDLQPTFFKTMKYNKNAPYSKKLIKEEYMLLTRKLMEKTQRFKLWRKQGKAKSIIYDLFEKPVKMKVYSWNGMVDTVMSPLDSILYTNHFLQSGLMSFDPKTGHIKAYVGGIDYNAFQYDHVMKGKRQVGSTFKPFLYTLAMQEGIPPCQKFPDVPTVFNLEGGDWSPGNAGGNKGKMITLSHGLATSNNNISSKLMKMFNPRPVINIAREMGLTNAIPATPSICLGVSDHTLYEMVGAYGTFINKGIYTKPILVTKIEDKYGNVITNFQTERNEAISEETAYYMVRMLQKVIEPGGTSYRIQAKYKLTNEIAGKTGTTNNNSDGWFIGFDPNLVTGVWVGAEDKRVRFASTRYGQGANMALPIWAEYMKAVYKDSLQLNYNPSARFEKPETLDFYKIDCTSEVEVEDDGYDFYD